MELPTKGDSINQDALLDDNASIFSILPLLIHDLFHWESHITILMKYLLDQMVSSEVLEESQAIQLQAIYSNVQELVNKGIVGHNDQQDVLTIDEDKSILLSFAFGRTLSDATSILSDPRNIEIVVHCPDGTSDELVHKQAGDYLKGKYEGPAHSACYPISVKVTQLKPAGTRSRTRVSRKRDAEIRQRLAHLDLEELLHNAGITIDASGELTTSANAVSSSINLEDDNRVASANVEEKNLLLRELAEGVTTKTVQNVVDLKSWYCTCDEFQACYVSQTQESLEDKGLYHSDNKTASACFLPGFGTQMMHAEHLTAKFLDNAITRYFRSLLPENRTKHLSPLPRCCHILALAIAAENSSHAHPYYTITSLDTPWPMIM